MRRRAVLEEDENTLVGAIVSIDQCIRNFRKFTKCSIEEALRDATLNPAVVLNIQDRKGQLKPHMDADFVFFLIHKPDCNAHIQVSSEVHISDGSSVNASFTLLQFLNDLAGSEFRCS